MSALFDHLWQSTLFAGALGCLLCFSRQRRVGAMGRGSRRR